MCDHQFSYAGVRYCHGRRLPGTGATQRYYAHVYFCSKCTETKGEAIPDPNPHDPVWTSYQKLEFGATPGTPEQCGIPQRDSSRF